MLQVGNSASFLKLFEFLILLDIKMCLLHKAQSYRALSKI